MTQTSGPFELGDKFVPSMPTKAIKTTQLTLEHLRATGYPSAAVVEKWNQKGRGGHGIRQDLFGCIDVIGIGAKGTIAVQCCARSDIAAHARKVTESKHLQNMLDAGWLVVIHGWKRHPHHTTLKTIEITEAVPLELTG